MPGGGWGRRAATNVNNKLEDDELFKEIGGQLCGSSFDYSQWRRQGKPATPAKKTLLPRKKKAFTVFQPFVETLQKRSHTPSIMIHDVVRDASRLSNAMLGVGSASRQSSLIEPLKPRTMLEEILDKKKTEQQKVLQLRIMARKQTIKEYQVRHAELLAHNMKLRTDIESDEGGTHSLVKALLRRYEKYRGGIANMNMKFGNDVVAVHLERDMLKMKIKQDKQALEDELAKINEQLTQSKAELHVLINYKDKEYPVKALRILELQKEIEQLNIHNEREEHDLQHIVVPEIDKMRKEHEDDQKHVTAIIVEDAINMMPEGLKTLALANMVMKQEREFHIRELVGLESDIEALKASVRDLKNELRTCFRANMFPDLFTKRTKCTPDMDIILNIPMQHMLPI